MSAAPYGRSVRPLRTAVPHDRSARPLRTTPRRTAAPYEGADRARPIVHRTGPAANRIPRPRGPSSHHSADRHPIA
ncbi:hypothetical protein DVA86_17185 [Streptomyces armeniacus]|uniref:Uncharacterized protein n=1 Tax=Streptomyces armeniacus TaxID=83291 RepID=A0A345XR67_9ACTN|nr:hypothetical protein DVA86_17185 [Streptomyces armeniacus]